MKRGGLSGAAMAGAGYASLVAMNTAEAHQLQELFIDRYRFDPLQKKVYESWTHRNSFFATVDNFYIDPFTGKRWYQEVSDDQIQWLAGELEKNKLITHKFVFSHKPPVSVTTNKIDTDLWNLVDQYDVTAVFFRR